jgi:photosystem II stability/assembly factor-like uncharacterized protein
MTRAGLAILVAVLLAACGSAGSASGERTRALSDRLVDFKRDPPYINALDVDPADGRFLLTTNRGFFRIDPDSRKVAEVRGTISARGRRATVGTFLELLVTGPGRLLGSGHPDHPGTLPGYLGFIRSDDGGRTWRVVARLGEADLHKIVAIHGRLYAFDAVLGAILISEDGGRTFTENFTPRALVIDFVVDPQDPAHVIASTEDQVFRSENEGSTWRGITSGRGVRLVWPARDALVRADRDGTVMVSRDRGRTFKRVGEVPGEPYKFKALDARRLLLALSDGTIMRTDDGGVTWTTAFAP